MVTLQQIDSWRTIQGSGMGDPALLPQQTVSLDDDLPMTMVMQFCQSAHFKRPYVPPKKFRIDMAPSPRQLRMTLLVSSMQSSVHAGKAQLMSLREQSRGSRVPAWVHKTDSEPNMKAET